MTKILHNILDFRCFVKGKRERKVECIYENRMKAQSLSQQSLRINEWRKASE